MIPREILKKIRQTGLHTNRVMAGRGQFPRQTAGQLRVHEEFHAATGSMLLLRLKRAA